MNYAKKAGMAAVAGAIALGAGLGLNYRADAQEPTPTPAPTEAAPADGATKEGRGGPHRGGRGMGDGTALAEALGVSVETLEAAQESARAAVEAQRPTDETTEGRRGPRGWMESVREAYDTALAEALGVSGERLDAAQETARATMIADAVAEGRITQAQADLMAARAAFREAVNERAIIAQALGMTTEALDAALGEGQRLPELIEAAGLTRDEFRDAMTTAFEAAVDAAVVDGTITQAQGDVLKEEGMRGRPGMGRRGPRGGMHFHFHFHGDAPSTTPDSGT